MKLIITLFVFLSLLGHVSAQLLPTDPNQTPHVRCYTNEMQAEAISQNPSIVQRKQALQQAIQKHIDKARLREVGRTPNVVYRIPVVVHVVYRTSAGNVSDARVLEQIDVLTEDFRRTNSDAGNTPSTFSSIVADTEIEFCLATKDPTGNSTTGITRTQTTISNIGSTSSYYSTAAGGQTIWNPNNYLNIWVCEIGGGILGYTYTPGGAPNGADGVVIDYRYFGKTGASAPYNGGRTTTHEVGHWLNLEHIWGTSGGCSNDDGVSDTPMQTSQYGGCPSHPQSSCSSTDMFMNYMDYVNDACMNAFTLGQKSRMRSAITAARPGLITSQGCITAADDAGITAIVTPTGTICTFTFSPVVTLKNHGSNTLTSVTINYNLNGTGNNTYAWTGTLASQQAIDVTLPSLTTGISFNSFTVFTSSPNGSSDGDPSNDTRSTTFLVSSTPGLALPFFEGFESTTFPPTGWTIDNPDNSITWARSTAAAKTGSGSMFMDNWDYTANGEVDWIDLPALDFSNSSSASMSFELAYALYSATGYSDTLRVWVSGDCGVTWNKAYEKFDNALTTVSSLYTVEFIPTANDWRQETIDLTGYINNSRILIRFEHVTDYENNLHIDDVNITSVPATSVNQVVSKARFDIYPNPTSGEVFMNLMLDKQQTATVSISNSLGQVVYERTLNDVMQSSWQIDVRNQPAGLYHVTLKSNEKTITKRLVLQK